MWSVEQLTSSWVMALVSPIIFFACETGVTSAQAGQPWHSSILLGAVAGIFAAITLGLLRWLKRVTFLCHDRSALAYLGKCLEFQCKTLDLSQFANVPIYRDNQRRYQLNDKILTNNDPMDVIGFVVGSPRFLQHPPHDGEPGYYAYVVINWEMADNFRRWVKRGFGIQVSGIATEEGTLDTREPDNRHLVVAPFSQEGRRVVDICEGFRHSFRWQPYKRWGFTPDDLANRSRSWQSKILISIVRRFS